MSTLEESFAAACSSGKIPGAVLVATDTSGSFTYSEAFGFRSLEDDNKLPMELDTLMTLASCTKLITTIAALQLVERGHIGLGDDVADILPELSELEIFQGMMDGKGVLNKRKNPITLRQVFLTRHYLGS
jgi:CubicO group peptidase (beta-lactamase class C family)